MLVTCFVSTLNVQNHLFVPGSLNPLLCASCSLDPLRCLLGHQLLEGTRHTVGAQSVRAALVLGSAEQRLLDPLLGGMWESWIRWMVRVYGWLYA